MKDNKRHVLLSHDVIKNSFKTPSELFNVKFVAFVVVDVLVYRDKMTFVSKLQSEEKTPENSEDEYFCLLKN